MKQIMKKGMIAFVLLMCSVVAFSQSDISEKKLKYGISLGMNYSYLEVEELPTNAVISDGYGFQLGILADYKITNFLSLSPRTELSFNDTKLIYNDATGSSEYLVLPINVGLAGYATLRLPNDKLEPYIYFGPKYRLSLSKKPTTSAEFPTNSCLSFDVGIGLEKAFQYFHIAPELRYSYGITDVNGNPIIKSIHVHNVSLIFNFLG